MTRVVDRLTPQNSSGIPFVNLWNNKVAANIEAALANIQSQIDSINAILDPNTLTPDKKPVWMFIYSFLTGEQSGLDAEATTFGITTAKTTYDNAITTLTSYLATLTTPVAWNNTSGNTTIVDATFRTNFANVLTAKQVLLDKMHDTSRSLANTAQSTAATAQTTATTANTAATAAQTTADTVKRDDSISTSWPSPGTAVSASDAGSDATITIANHTRHYSNTDTASVTGGSITGLAYSTTYYVYYDQTSRAGGAVTYHATTNPNTALPGAAAGRHYVAVVTTPASGGTATTGTGSSGGGGGSFGGGNIP